MSSNSASGGASTGSGSNNTPAGGGHQPHYPQANSLVFVVNPLPSSEEQLNERILDAAEKLRNQASNNTTTTGSSSQPSAVQNNGSNPTTNIPVISFNRDDVSVPNGNQEQLSVLCNPPRSSIDSQNEQQQQQTSTNAEPNRVNVLQCVISSGHVAVLLEDNRICRFPYNIYPERISSANGGEASSSTKSTLSTPSHRPLNSPSSSSLVSSSSARTVQTARRRLIRSSSRPRTSASVIMGRGHVIPAQFVPEDLINQAQVVLQGKSRNVIIRELQRTNLDVNLAVNNLLSRDDEEFDDAEDGPEQMIQSDDLMSLLDSGFPNESVIIDSDFADEVFSYPLRIRSSSALFNNSGSAGSGSGAAGSGSGAAAGGGTGSGGSSSSSRPSRLRDDAFSFIERDLQLSSGSGTKSRWYSYNSENSKADALAGSSRSSKSNLKTSDTTLQLAPISFYEQQQEFWPNASDKKFVAIASIYSELIAITAQGQLCQWRWQDVEPFKGQLSDGTVYYHPKVPSLGLLQEKVNLLSASCIRATVATESGKLATWIDESISPIASKLEHAATSSIFAESAQSGPSTAATSNISPPPKIALLYVSSLMSCVQLSTGALYWWGIPPFSYRKKLVEKVKNERNKPSKSKSNNASGGTSSATAGGVSGTSVPATSNIKENTDIVQGALVCMRNSPIYQNGSIAFTTVGGVPKVGQLVNSAWKMTDCCSFRVLSHAEIQSRLQPSGGSVLSLNQRTIKDSLSVDSKCEMPPPPSPASSTSSDPGYNPPLPKRAKRSSNSGSGSAAGGSGQSGGSASDQAKQEQVLLGANIIERVESWNLKDVVFMEDVKSMPIGRVIKVDGNYVAVKFSHGMINESQQQQGVAKGSGSSGTAFDFSFENYIQDCRLMRKDELAVMKSSPTLGQVQSTAPSTCPASNSYGTKAYDCLQRYPKRVHIPEHVQIVAMTLTNLGLHCIAKIGGYRFSYILINIVTGRIEQDSKISIEYNTFSGNTSTNPKTSLIRLYSAGETDTTTVVLCRDGNGTLYPLAKDCTESLIREPIALNLGPVSTIGLGIYALPSAITNAAANANSGSGAPGSGSSSAPKTHAAILGLAFEPQLLMSAILKSDLDLVRERLDMLERYPHIYHPMICELCDGNHNIIHIAASACSPTTNKLNGQTTSSATGNILNMFDSDEILTIERSPEPFISSVSNDQPMECNFDTTAEPLLDPNEQKPIAHSILWTLLDSKVLFGHLLDLLSARDFNGHTPFMLAIAGRAYSAANQLFIWCQKIAHHYTVATCPIGSAAYKDQFKRTLMQMVYPRGSLPDHSPLYMLCSNDTCSFTWTGEEHINQDIFECRTCGLVGSLCCCTECARVCHRGHDCKLKRTSPTAYCDCWEKCKCKALISGCQPARYELLRKLLAHTDLSLRVNSRGEHIMLYLVQTVGRQIIEQKQYRPSRLRASNSSSRNKTETNEEGTATVPEHDLEPPKFARRALEKFINDWPTVKSMILTGYRAPENNNQQHKRRSYLCGFFNGTSNAYAYEEENAYLARQNGSALLDKFTHSLLRIGLDMIEKLIVTLLMACNNQFPEARAVTRRFVRSVARVGLVVCFELNPTLYASLAPMSGLVSLIERALGGNGSSGASGTYSSSSALSKKTSALSILSKCRRIFLSFLPIAIEELCEIAESLIAPVKLGIARPSGPFVLSPTSTEVLASTDEIFSVDTSIYAHQRDFLDSAFGLEVHEEPGSQHAPPPPPPVVVPAPIPAVSQENLIVPNVVANNFAGAFDAPMGVNVDHIDARNGPIADEVIIRNDLAIEPMDTSSGVGPSNGSVSIDQIAGPSSGSAPENGADVIVASNEDISSEPPPSIDSDEPFHRRDDMVIIGEMLVGSEHDEDNSNVGGRDSESDSESNPDDASYLSNADNASMAQRSVVTGATAGSDVGVSSLPYDDESVNSNGEDVDDDDDDDGEADDNDDDDDDNSDASDTAETEPEQEDIPFLDDQVDRPLRGSSSSNFGPNSALVNGLASIGSHNSRRDNILHHVQWALRQRDINGGASGSAAAASASQDSGFRRAAISNVLVAGDNVVSMSNSSVGLARAFSIVIRQIGDLMPILRDPHELNTSGFMHLPFTPAEALALQQTVEDRLRNTWDWLINIMDSTETQLRFGCALSNRRLTSTVSSSLSSSTSSSAQAAASISNAVAFSTTGVSSASNTAASNSLRRLRAFQNHDDMLFLPSLSRTTSALRRMSGLGLGRASSSSANGAAGASSGAGAGSSAAGSGSSGAAPSSSLSMDSNFARRDFLNYAMSLMRAHSNEHYDSLPVLDVSSLKHLAYAFDAFIYYIRRGLVTSYQQQQQQTPTEESQEYALEQSIVTEADGSECSEKSSDVPSGRSSRFFRRSNSTLFLGCPPPDPFSAPFHEALPLASKPHLLQPNARREQLFGVPRPSNSTQAEEMIESLPSQMGLTKRQSQINKQTPSTPAPNVNTQTQPSHHHNLSTPMTTLQVPQRNQSVIAENSTSPSRSSIIQITPTKASVIVLAGSAKHQATTATTQTTASSHEPETKNNMCSVISKGVTSITVNTVLPTKSTANISIVDNSKVYANFYYGNQEKHDSLLGRWRLSLELFGRLFVDDVGLEPSSIMTELSGFPVKETKFRREMERLRNPNSSSSSSSSSQRDISFLKLDRERGLMLQQTFKELNSVFSQHSRRLSSSSSSSQHLAITRVKVTFKDEPGEGSGVARSFYTAFSEAALANEKLPSLDWLVASSNSTSSGRGGSSNSFSTSGGSSPYHNFQYNMIRVANANSISAAVANVLANGGSSGGGASGSGSSSQRSVADDSLRRPRSPSRLRLFTSRRSHLERFRNELRAQNAFGPGGSGSSGSSGAGGSGSGSSSGLGPSGSFSGSSRSRNSSGPILRYESAPFVPTQYVSLSTRFASSSPVISSDSRITLGHRIYGRVYPLQPNHAPKITGMLLDLPSHDLIPILTSDEEFRNQVEQAVDIINTNERINAAVNNLPPGVVEVVVPPEQIAASVQESSAQNYKASSSGSGAVASGSVNTNETELPDEEDNAPLFYQPGPRGFYSPRAGRCTEARLNAFRNVGRIMGICFVQNELCPITFNRHVIKVVLGRPVSWHDLAFFDSDLYESLRQLILDAESTNKEEIFAELDFRFSIDVTPEEGGQEVELVPNGRNIRVTPANVFNYVRLYALYRMVISQLPAIQALRTGIFDVLPAKSFDGLTTEDFRLLLNGVNEINVQLLQSYVTFHDESGDGSEHLSYFRRWFWWVVERMNNEEKQDLIYFWTGSPALPASEEGFQPMPSITIRPRDDFYFVTANTCISRLYIPLYSSRNILRQKLLISIKAKSFGFI